jgi:hypothetical protein
MRVDLLSGPTTKNGRQSMPQTRGRRVAGAALLVGAPLAAVAMSGTASAVSFSGAGVVCTRLKGSTTTDTAQLSGCSNGPTGGSGVIDDFQPTVGDITWANGSTTDYTAAYTNPVRGCPPGSSLFKITGSVGSGTNPSTPVGASVKMKVCYNQTTAVLKNETGTVVKF